MIQPVKEKIILGIDPGTTIMGYGVLRVRGTKPEMIAMGIIDLRKFANHYLKLRHIHERVLSIIESYLPDELAIEAPFFGKNVQSMLKLGRAQGVAMAVALSRDIPITEYAPLKIKMAITGNGQASKEQVADMLQRMLRFSKEDMPTFMDATDGLAAAYCHFLQMGRPDNDFLIYLSVYDMWNEQPGRLLLFTIHHMDKLAPKFINAIHRINNSGYDGDYISDNFIRSTRFKNGQLVTSGGTGYKALVVPAAHLMPSDVLAHLYELAKQGATIVFLENYPTDVPGYGQLEQKRKSYQQTLKNLPAVSFSETTVTPIGKGKIITGTDYARTLASCNIPAEEMKTKFGLQTIRRVNNTGHHYFISSLQNKGVDGWITLGTNAETAALFNPMTGECGEAKVRQVDGKTQVYLQLKSGESIILQTYRQPLQASKPWKYVKEQPFSLRLDHGWKLHFAESTPEIQGTFDIDRPCSWTNIDHPAAQTNMGTGVYSLNIELPALKADNWILDLGDVRESARVRINGQEAGCVWAVPYQLKVGQFLKPGKNHIEIEVTNLPANRIAELDRQGVQWRKFKEINIVDLRYRPANYGHWAPMPSGLNSEVRLIPVDFIQE